MKRPHGIRGMVKSFMRKRGIVYAGQRHLFARDFDIFLGRTGLNAIVPDANANVAVLIPGIARVGLNRRKLKKRLPALLADYPGDWALSRLGG